MMWPSPDGIGSRKSGTTPAHKFDAIDTVGAQILDEARAAGEARALDAADVADDVGQARTSNGGRSRSRKNIISRSPNRRTEIHEHRPALVASGGASRTNRSLGRTRTCA